MNASTVSSEHSEEMLLNIARLAYRLGRQDQQRILERKLYKHYGNGFQVKLLSDLAKGLTDDLVDFPSIVRAAQEHSTTVNRSESCPTNEA